MNFQPCISCGSYEINPATGLCDECAELVARWSTHYVPIDAAVMVRRLLAELNAIIATKPDPVENRQTAASGPMMHESVWCDGKNVTLEEMIEKAKDVDQWREIKPVIEPAVAEKVYEIASRAVRDAMPDVLDAVAEAIRGYGFAMGVKGLREHADKLRKEKTPGHAAAVAAVSDAIGKACEAERKERWS